MIKVIDYFINLLFHEIRSAGSIGKCTLLQRSRNVSSWRLRPCAEIHQAFARTCTLKSTCRNPNRLKGVRFTCWSCRRVFGNADYAGHATEHEGTEDIM
jgi:hypothetical protein